jgi:hypothetical protein
MRKKAQANHIFMYIVAVLVLGLIVLVGYMAVSKIVPQMCETSKVTFEKNLHQMIKENRDFGTVKNDRFSLPCSYQGVCFIDAQKTDLIVPADSPSYEQELKDYVGVGAAVNVFYVNEKGQLEELAIYQQEKAPVELADDYICFTPETGILDVTFRGKGKTVSIS